MSGAWRSRSSRRRGTRRKAKLGPDHPDTLATLHNLAWAYQAAGKLPKAIALLERVRDAQIAKLGPDHPDTLITLNNLASAYRLPAEYPRRSPCSSASATH